MLVRRLIRLCVHFEVLLCCSVSVVLLRNA
jgi:hypothetical protein